MIQLKDLAKRYGNIIAVDGVSLKVKKGEILVILGPSGCGKTTLLRLIAGFERPDSGEIVLDGRAVNQGEKMTAPKKRNLGMIFQDLALWPHMTVRDNVEFGLRSTNLTRGERHEKVDRILVRMNLHGRGECHPGGLSGGEKQRVALARTIVLEPKIVLMDEPLASLDPLLKEELGQMIKSLGKGREITIAYVTHDQIEAVLMADRIAVMNHGRIEQEGTIQECRADPKNEFVKRLLMANTQEPRV